jgi:hypothetical protein
MILSVEKIKIFNFFVKNNQINTVCVMSIIEFLSSQAKISFNEKWKAKIISILKVISRNWNKTRRSGRGKKKFLENLSKQYFKFNLNDLQNDSDIFAIKETISVMEIDPISLENIFFNLRI